LFEHRDRSGILDAPPRRERAEQIRNLRAHVGAVLRHDVGRHDEPNDLRQSVAQRPRADQPRRIDVAATVQTGRRRKLMQPIEFHRLIVLLRGKHDLEGARPGLAGTRVGCATDVEHAFGFTTVAVDVSRNRRQRIVDVRLVAGVVAQAPKHVADVSLVGWAPTGDELAFETLRTVDGNDAIRATRPRDHETSQPLECRLIARVVAHLDHEQAQAQRGLLRACRPDKRTGHNPEHRGHNHDKARRERGMGSTD
jgi:hypothetical protein